MRDNWMRAQPGYRTRRYVAVKPTELIPDLVKRDLDVSQPNKIWVTDITYVRTWEGWLYVVVAARPTIHRELVLNAILMAVRRRKP